MEFDPKPLVLVQPPAKRANASAAYPLHGGCTYLQLVLELPVYLAVVIQADVCACLLWGGTATYLLTGVPVAMDELENLRPPLRAQKR